MSETSLNQSHAGEIDWQRLYEMHAPLVRRHAAKFVDASLVDDIVQETFLRAYRNRHSIRPDRPLGPWLTVIARRAAIDVVRRHAVRDRVSRDVEIPQTPLEPVEDDYFNAVRRAAIKDVFGSLNERHRRVLANTILHPGAGTASGTADDSTRSALARARQGFRSRYRELSEKTGVFGSAIVAMRRKGASTRDALIRAEPWLQAGMPVLIAACAGVALMPSSMAFDHALAGSGDSSPARQTVEVLGRQVGSHAAAPTGHPAADERDAFVVRPRGESGPISGSEPVPRIAQATMDWNAGREGDRGDIHLYARSEGMHGDTWTYAGTGIDCGGRSMAAAALCGTWDVVPDDRRHHEAGVDNYGAVAGLDD